MELGTKSLGPVNTSSAYSQSFGALPNGTLYAGGVHVKSDLRTELKNKLDLGLKAHGTTAGGAGTAGYAMIPVFVDPQIVDVSRKYTPLVEIFPRVTNQGMTADFNKLTTKGGGFCATEDAALTEKDNTYNRASVGIKNLYAVGRVTGQSQAAQPSYMMMGFQPTGDRGAFSDQLGGTSKQLEVLVQARAIKELEENLIINGNVSTSGVTGNPNGTEFDGIIALQSTTNKVDKNTTALDLADIQTAIQSAYDDGGRPTMAVCSSAVFSDLLNLLQAKSGYLAPQVDVEFGFTYITLHTMVGPIRVVPSMFLSNTSGSKAIYFLDMGVWEMRVLQDMTYEDLAKTNDSQKFMLKMYEALICRNTAFNSWIGEIA